MKARDGVVSIAILNWNSKRYLLDCVASALAQTYPAVELILIDNASTDDSVEWVRSCYPDLPILQNDANLGFAKAHNTAIRKTDGEFYMPLNPDVILAKDFVTEMVQAIRRSDEIGSAQGKVFFSDETGRCEKIFSTGHLLTKNRKSANRGYKKKDTGKYEQMDLIFGPNGACPLYRRAMLEDIQMDGQYLDENYFLYGEDYDLCWRAQWLGWRSIYTPRAVAQHVHRGTGGFDKPFIQYQFARNQYMTVLKNDHWSHFLLDLPYILLWEWIWQAHTLVTNPRRMLSNLGAYVGFVRAIPAVLRQRQQLVTRRRVTPHYMRSLFTGIVLR